MSRCLILRRPFMGWDITHDPNHTGINWTARKERSDGGHKLRADTLAGLRRLIIEAERT